MTYAKEHNLPVMIDFTGYGCVNCRKMEAAVFTDPTVADIMTNKYVLIQLYVDDKTAIPEPIIVSENGTERKLRTVGDRWSYLQSQKFGANAQPFYVLLDNDGNLLAKNYSYDEDIPKFIQWLNNGLSRYDNL
jgi:thiol:disulfide interchange protein DsbD